MIPRLSTYVLIAYALIGHAAIAEEKSGDKIDQLSEILGKSHAIQTICNGRADQYWREQMYALLDLEAPGEGAKRNGLIEAFNSGFETQAAETPECNSRAKIMFSDNARKGQRLAEELNSLISDPQ